MWDHTVDQPLAAHFRPLMFVDPFIVVRPIPPKPTPLKGLFFASDRPGNPLQNLFAALGGRA
jgi:hypothetical protein